MTHRHLPFILSLGLLVLFYSCGNKEEQAPQQAQQQAMPFEVTELPQKTVTGYTAYPTTIEGIVNSEVRAKVSGYIQKVLVDEGQKVKAGQPLFKLETQTLNQDANAAQAAVNAARVEVEKLIPLVEKNIISAVQLETAKANLAEAQASYSSVAANIGYGTVKSPVDGFVGAIPYREGSLASETSDMPLTTVSDIKQVYAYFSMNETEYLDFLQSTKGANLKEKVGNVPEVQLVLANGYEYPEKGKIQTVTGQIDQSTGTVSFRAIFDNPNQLVTNGNSGTIRIPVVYDNVVVVPQSATFEQQGQIIVYKVSEDNKAISTVITIKGEVDNMYVIESGLQKGDKIVVEGIGKLKNETPIQPKEVAFDSVAKPIKPLFQ